MLRFAYALLVILSSITTIQAAPVPITPPEKQPAKQPPNPEAIKKAVQELGSPRFPLRERASKFLWEAGSSAEKALEEAERSTDTETSTRAKTILEKFRWGLYPDTPENIRSAIELFRDGDAEQRKEAIGKLLDCQPIPIPLLVKLIAKETDLPARTMMYNQLAGLARGTIPGLLLRGDYAVAEQLLEITVLGSPVAMGADYAAFVYLRGTLDAKIRHYEAELQKAPKDEKATFATILVYLYRVKGNWKAAQQVVLLCQGTGLKELLLWEAGDWKGLDECETDRDFRNQLGEELAYARLSGNTTKFDAIVEKASKIIADENAEPNEIRHALDALLLNGKSKLAIELMIEHKQEAPMAFDLLCAQMRHKEAFELLEKMDTHHGEGQHADLRRARMLFQLGEKDAAKQLFSKQLEENLRKKNDVVSIRKLLTVEARLGLKDLVIEHTAKALEGLKNKGIPDASPVLFEVIFGEENKLVAMSWWNLMREHSPDEDHLVSLKRVRDLISGKLEKKAFAEWVGKMVKRAEADVVRGEEERLVMPQNAYLSNLAVASAYQAIQDDKKGEEYLKKSAEATPLPHGWIRLGDFLMQKKRFKEAAECYAKAAKRAQRDVLIVGGQELDPSLGDFLDDPALATYLQGRALKAAGELKEGTRLIEIAHWLPLSNEETRGHLITELAKRDWPEMAQKEAEMIQKTGWYKEAPMGNVISGLARLAIKQKQYAKASAFYQRCTVGCMRTGASFVEPTAYLIIPESIRINQARGLLQDGKTTEAFAKVKASLEVLPGNVDLAIKMVPEFEKKGQKKEADAIYASVKTSYEKLLKDYPNSAFARNSLAWAMVNCRRELAVALKHSEKAVELEPGSGGYRDTLAEILFRMGNRDKAIEQMKKCRELEPTNNYYRKQLERFKKEAFDSPTPEEEDDD